MTQKNTKTIPAGYKQTEIGVIPVDWDVKKLDDIFNISAGRDFVKSDYSEIQDEGHKYPIYSNSLENKGLYGYTKIARHKKDCITITARGTIGHSNKRYTNFDAIGRLLILDPKAKLDGFFISEYLNNKVTFSIESTGVPQLTAPQASKYLIAFPDANEQAAIATVLSNTDTLIEKLEKLITKKKALRQGTAQQLLTEKKHLPGFSGKWELKKLGELLEYEQPTNYIVKNTEYSEKNNIPVLTAGKSFILGYTDENFGIFKKLPVIIFDDFTTAAQFVNFSFKVKSSAMKILKPRREDVNLRFVYEKMKLIDFKLGDHKRYWISEYQNIEIKIPKSEEQTAIATVLFDMNNEIEKLENKLNKYRQIKIGMMQQLLTGKIRLNKD